MEESKILGNIKFSPHAWLFTDGSSSKSQDIGAWAAIAATSTQRKVLFGALYPTTISRCELVPIIEGLRWIKLNWAHSPGFRVAIISDSDYTIKTLNGLCQRSKNQELWVSLDETVKELNVKYYWRERNSLPYMELCDCICGSIRHSVYKAATELWVEPREPEKRLPMSSLPDLPEELI